MPVGRCMHGSKASSCQEMPARSKLGVQSFAKCVCVASMHAWVFQLHLALNLNMYACLQLQSIECVVIHERCDFLIS